MAFMNPELVAAFLIAAFVLVVVPGPDMMFIIAAGMRGGPAAGFVAASGVATGLIVHVVMVVLGLTAVFRVVPLAHDVLRLAGAAYLLWMGCEALRTRRELPMMTDASIDTRRVFSRALLTNLLNPKVIIFNAAFLPQFVDPARGHIGLQLAVLGVCFIAIDLAIDGPIGLLAGRIGRWLGQRQGATRGINRIAGTIYIGLAGWLLADGRA